MTDFQKACQRYANGKWQKAIPQEAGLYMRLTAYGEPGGICVVFQDPTTQKYVSAQSWGGYYWSVPTPEPQA